MQAQMQAQALGAVGAAAGARMLLVRVLAGLLAAQHGK